MPVGFEGLKAMLEFNRSQKTIEEESLEQNQCPFCDWSLKINSETHKRSCSLCGRIYDE